MNPEPMRPAAISTSTATWAPVTGSGWSLPHGSSPGSRGGSGVSVSVGGGVDPGGGVSFSRGGVGVSAGVCVLATMTPSTGLVPLELP